MFRHVLVPVDHTELADEAIARALAVAEQFGSHLHVLFVRTDAGSLPADDRQRDLAEFDVEEAGLRALVHKRLRTGHVLPDHRIHPRVMTGDPVDGIVTAIADTGADLVVMGTHGRHGLVDRLVGSTTERVLQRVRIPVLVVWET
jgi:nucleotide-binding universal stress UspA family protein